MYIYRYRYIDIEYTYIYILYTRTKCFTIESKKKNIKKIIQVYNYKTIKNYMHC